MLVPKNVLGGLLLTLLLPLYGRVLAQATTEPPASRPGVEVLTAEDLAQAGAMRLSDLFSLLEAWYGTSVEGYALDVAPNGLAAAQEASWTVMIDGQPVDLRVLDRQNINSLPLSLSQIAYVEVSQTPTLIAGVFAQAGVMHLHTFDPEPGATLSGSFAAGNEIGDPGPFRYTDFDSPNIDRIGPNLNVSAAYRGAGWHLRSQLKVDEHHGTDERMLQRVRDLYQGIKSPRLLLKAPSVDAGWTGPLGTHTLYAGFSRLEDLHFFDPLGQEVPTDHKFTHLGLQGDFAPGQPTGLSYRLSYTVSDLDFRNNKGRLDFDWRQDRLRGHYEVRLGQQRWISALGLSYDYYRSAPGLTLNDTQLFIPRPYGRFRLFGGRWAYETSAYVTRVKGEVGYGALVTATIRPTSTQTLTFIGSVTRRPYAETNSLWYWVRNGYAFAERAGASVTLPAAFSTSTTLTGDLSWKIHPSDRFNLTLSGGYRRFARINLADYTYQFTPLTTAFATDTVVRSDVYGRVATASATLQFKIAPSLMQRIHVTYLRYPTSDFTYFKAWRSQPWSRFSYTARYTPQPRLSLYARLAYTSETQWPAFRQAATDADGLYEADLPAYWLLNLTVQKRFWQDHIQGSLSLRNFLNEAYRQHPAGAITNLIFGAKLLFYFNSGY